MIRSDGGLACPDRPSGGGRDIVPGRPARRSNVLNKAAANGYAGPCSWPGGEDHPGQRLRAGRPGERDQETAGTVFSIGSITKQFTGAAILKLEMTGKLSVQDPITKYFGAVPATRRGSRSIIF